MAPANDAPVGPGSGIRVLVVDDDDEIRRLLRVKLVKAGFDFEEAANTEQALHVLRGIQVDVVVCENMLSDGDATSLIATLSALPISEPPFVVLGEGDDDADICGALRGGADDYVPKPFSPRELIQRIRTAHLRRRCTERTDLFFP